MPLTTGQTENAWAESTQESVRGILLHPPRAAAPAGVAQAALEARAGAKDGLALHALDDVGLDARLCELGPVGSLGLEGAPVVLALELEARSAVRVCAEGAGGVEEEGVSNRL